eukprot:3154267-Rhodomonas_salina.1
MTPHPLRARSLFQQPRLLFLLRNSCPRTHSRPFTPAHAGFTWSQGRVQRGAGGALPCPASTPPPAPGSGGRGEQQQRVSRRWGNERQQMTRAAHSEGRNAGTYVAVFGGSGEAGAGHAPADLPEGQRTRRARLPHLPAPPHATSAPDVPAGPGGGSDLGQGKRDHRLQLADGPPGQ